MRSLGIFLWLVFATGVLTPTVVWARKLKPVDEGARDPSFARFRANLIRATQRHDYAAIIQVLDADVEASLGDERSIPAFRHVWKGKHSQLYRELAIVLRLGGSFSRHGEEFCAPYVWSDYGRHPGDMNPLSGYVRSARVPLRKSPRAGAPALAWLSYDVLPQLDFPPVRESLRGRTRRWYRVRTAYGKWGYVEARYVRSVMDYRAMFERKHGRWVMTAFVAGD
jgi:hypothetical protein